MTSTLVNGTAESVSVDTDYVPVRENSLTRRFFSSGMGEPIALIGALIVLILIFSILNPRFATVENLQNILNQASLPLIIGVGATFVILIGSIDLSVEGVMGAAGVAFVLMSANTRGSEDLGAWAFIGAIGMGILLGAVNGLLFTKVKIPSFIVTLGMWFVGIGIATIMYGTDALPSLTNSELTNWAAKIVFGLPNIFWLAAIITIIAAVVLRFTSFGRVALAVGNNESIARANGMAITRNKILIFVVAGAMSGLAGILASMQMGAVSNNIGAGYLFITIPAVVIGGTSLSGGKGGMARTAIGVLLLTVLSNGLILSGVSPNYQSAVSGAILVIAIVAASWSQRGRLRIAK
jgi:ribose transport system permease protein